MANECVVVVHSRDRVCRSRSRHYRRLHRSGYSHHVADDRDRYRFALARCNKWPAAEESRLRQKGDAEPFLCGGPDTFCVENNNAMPLLRFVRCLSSSSAYYSRGESGEWSETGMPTHRISRACKACMALSKAKHTIFCYRSLPAIPFALPSSLPPTDCVGLPVM